MILIMFRFLFSPWLQKSLRQGVLLDKQGADLSLNSSGKKKKQLCIQPTYVDVIWDVHVSVNTSCIHSRVFKCLLLCTHFSHSVPIYNCRLAFVVQQ